MKTSISRNEREGKFAGKYCQRMMRSKEFPVGCGTKPRGGRRASDWVISREERRRLNLQSKHYIYDDEPELPA